MASISPGSIYPPDTTKSRSSDYRDMRDPATLGAALLALREGRKLPLSRLYDRHSATLDDAGR